MRPSKAGSNHHHHIGPAARRAQCGSSEVHGGGRSPQVSRRGDVGSGAAAITSYSAQHQRIRQEPCMLLAHTPHVLQYSVRCTVVPGCTWQRPLIAFGR
eukprot:COSAG01_NODE_3518_length_5980_cov_2.131780_5_plen_99_part_00